MDNNTLVRQMIAKKFGGQKAGQKAAPEETPLITTSQYEEARLRGDTTTMIGYKLQAKARGRKELMDLSEKYYKELSIKDILNKVDASEQQLESQKKHIEQLENFMAEEILSKNSKMWSSAGIPQSRQNKYVEDIMVSTDTYKAERAKYDQLKKENQALINARMMYIEDNKTLIEQMAAEKKKADLVASGLLEELGLKEKKPERINFYN